MFLLYIIIVISTYLFIDLLKIYLAKLFHHKLNQQVANKIRKGVGFILLILSVFIFLQSFKKFNQFDKRLEEAEKKEVKFKNHKIEKKHINQNNATKQQDTAQ